MTRTLLCALGLLASACLTRTNVGAEPIADSGVESDAGGTLDGNDAAPESERTATADFAERLSGVWQDEEDRFSLEFRSDGRYRSFDADSDLQSGTFSVTDQLATGRFQVKLLQDDGKTLLLKEAHLEGPEAALVLKFDIEASNGALSFDVPFTLRKLP